MSLTPHQRDVLAAHLRVGTYPAARDLGLSDQTVKNILSSIYRKLDVGTATQAALALGWLVLPNGETDPTDDDRTAALIESLPPNCAITRSEGRWRVWTAGAAVASDSLVDAVRRLVR